MSTLSEEVFVTRFFLSFIGLVCIDVVWIGLWLLLLVLVAVG
jgi:hypothetical protein